MKHMLILAFLASSTQTLHCAATKPLKTSSIALLTLDDLVFEEAGSAMTSADITLDRHCDLKVREHVERNCEDPEKLSLLFVEITKWRRPDLQLAQDLLALKVPVNACIPASIHNNHHGAEALTSATRMGQIELVTFLLDNRANIEVRCPWNGFTPLMYAARRCFAHIETESKRSVATLALLIERGANVNICTGVIPTTPLILAVEETQTEKVSLLLAAGANKTAADEYGRTALDVAKERFLAEEEFSRLLAADTDKTTADDYDRTESEYAKIIALLETPAPAQS